MTRRRDKCHWIETEEGQYETGCGSVWEFTSDGPEENCCAWCPYCGGSLTWDAYEESV